MMFSSPSQLVARFQFKLLCNQGNACKVESIEKYDLTDSRLSPRGFATDLDLGLRAPTEVHKESRPTMEADPQTNAVALSEQPGSLVPEEAERGPDAITPTLQ
jgi:hypothetical protein